MKIFPQHHQIKFEKINYVYDHLTTGLIMNVLVGGALFAVMVEVVQLRRVLSWYGLLLFVVTARFALLFIYRRSQDRLINLKKWQALFIAGTFLMGLVWGAGGIILFPENDVARQIFLSFVIGGMLMGAVPYLSPLFPAYLLYSMSAELPINYYLFTFPDSLHVILGVMNILFMVTMLIAAKLHEKNLINNLTLRYVNEDLVKKLNDTNIELGNKIYLKNQVEQELRENELRYKALSNAAHDGVILYKGNIIIEANQAAASMSGYSVKELVGKDILDVIAEESCQDIVARLSRPGEESFETNCIRKDGSVFKAEIKPDNVTYKGEPARFVSVRDVSIQKQIEADLLHAKQAAEDADKIKSEFLASVSHELRTPLNAIIGILQVLDESNLRQEQKDFLEMGEKAARQLLLLINDLLDLSRIESGNFAYNYENTNLNTLLYEVIQIMSFKAKENGNDLQLAISEDLPGYVRIEPDRLRQVLLNLLANAVKFTEAGQIILAVSVKHKTADMEFLHFEVMDNGIGIPEDKQQLIFNRFTQLDSSISRNYGGTGLGLAICSEIVKNMDGEIGVNSHDGKGACFWFDLPLTRVSQQEIDESIQLEDGQKLKPIKGLSVLLVEDDETNQIITKRMLEKLGCDVEVLSNGLQAVESKGKFDLIFMDIHMPVMDGLTATRALREKGLTTPIIALTANAMQEDCHRCQEAGMDDHISKPVEINNLYQVLVHWFGEKKQSVSQRRPK